MILGLNYGSSIRNVAFIAYGGCMTLNIFLGEKSRYDLWAIKINYEMKLASCSSLLFCEFLR